MRLLRQAGQTHGRLGQAVLKIVGEQNAEHHLLQMML